MTWVRNVNDTLAETRWRCHSRFNTLSPAGEDDLRGIR